MKTVGHKASRVIIHEPYEIGTTHEWFVMPLRATPWPKGVHASQRCPVCDGAWRPWPDSRLPCHARCLWTERGAVMLANDSRTEMQLETALGVTRSIIRAGKRIGEKLMSDSANARFDIDDDDWMNGIDKRVRCDKQPCDLILGHERQLTCRLRISAVKRGELQWLWHEPGCTLGPEHKDECTRRGYPTCGIGRMRAACERLYGHDGACSP